MSVRFSTGAIEIVYPDAVAADLLYLLNRPFEAYRLKGQWSFETLIDVYSRLQRLRNIENPDYVNSSTKVNTGSQPSASAKQQLDEFAGLVKAAIDSDAAIFFN